MNTGSSVLTSPEVPDSSANFVFWKEAGYFDTSSETKPLLHLWSLGIEEQFYILWPVLLWVFWEAQP